MDSKFIIPLIEDSVQVWHFYQLSRKYGREILRDQELHARFSSRINLIANERPIEKERYMEILEELGEDIVIKTKPQEQVVIPIEEPAKPTATKIKTHGKRTREVILELTNRVRDLESRILVLESNNLVMK